MTISNAQVATGLTYGWFRKKVLPHLKTRPVPGKKKPEYFLTEEFLPAVYKKNHKHEFTEEEIEELENESDDIVNNILEDISVNNISNENPENVDLNEARRQEILVRTKYLEQKIDKKKNELFEEWSERFFQIFSKNFAKFKNSLIELRLEEKQLKKLNENLDFALENMEEGLNEILNEYVNDEEDVKNE